MEKSTEIHVFFLRYRDVVTDALLIDVLLELFDRGWMRGWVGRLEVSLHTLSLKVASISDFVERPLYIRRIARVMLQ